MVTKLNLICFYFFIGLSLTSGYEWKYVGCYKDETGNPVLDGNVTKTSDMTRSFCEINCTPHRFYGLKNSNECICGENKGHGVPESVDCTSPCIGDIFSTCGGPDDITVYKKPEHYMGCYSQSIITTDRWIALQDDASLNPAKCRKRCGESTYTYAAIQSETCYCSNDIPEHPSLKDEHDCNKTCPGGSKQGCGGPSTVSVYEGKGYMGCFGLTDITESSESLDYQSIVVELENNFVQHCMATCKNGGYFYTAVSGKNCYCSNKRITAERLPYDSCNTKCPGDPNRFCGGQNAVSLYRTPKFYFDCMHFPSNDVWKKINVSDMTVAKCRHYCGSHLYDLAGLKVNNNHDVCYCSNKIHGNARIQDDTHCKFCPDDDGHLTCGGNDSISVYASIESYCHCSVIGDPHFTTFDKLHLSFQGQKTYVVSKTVGDVKCQFELIARNRPIRNGKYTVTDNATLAIDGNTYLFYGKGKIKVNGILLTENVNHPKFTATISVQFSQVNIKPCGVIIRSDRTSHLDIYLEKDEYTRHVKGVCGNCDGDRLNDFSLKNGTNVAHSPTHGEDVGGSFELK